MFSGATVFRDGSRLSNVAPRPPAATRAECSQREHSYQKHCYQGNGMRERACCCRGRTPRAARSSAVFSGATVFRDGSPPIERRTQTARCYAGGVLAARALLPKAPATKRHGMRAAGLLLQGGTPRAARSSAVFSGATVFRDGSPYRTSHPDRPLLRGRSARSASTATKSTATKVMESRAWNFPRQPVDTNSPIGTKRERKPLNSCSLVKLVSKRVLRFGGNFKYL